MTPLNSAFIYNSIRFKNTEVYAGMGRRCQDSICPEGQPVTVVWSWWMRTLASSTTEEKLTATRTLPEMDTWITRGGNQKSHQNWWMRTLPRTKRLTPRFLENPLTVSPTRTSKVTPRNSRWDFLNFQGFLPMEWHQKAWTYGRRWRMKRPSWLFLNLTSSSLVLLERRFLRVGDLWSATTEPSASLNWWTRTTPTGGPLYPEMDAWSRAQMAECTDSWEDHRGWWGPQEKTWVLHLSFLYYPLFYCYISFIYLFMIFFCGTILKSYLNWIHNWILVVTSSSVLFIHLSNIMHVSMYARM